jgi:hypothetical protein
MIGGGRRRPFDPDSAGQSAQWRVRHRIPETMSIESGIWAVLDRLHEYAGLFAWRDTLEISRRWLARRRLRKPRYTGRWRYSARSSQSWCRPTALNNWHCMTRKRVAGTSCRVDRLFDLSRKR